MLQRFDLREPHVSARLAGSTSVHGGTRSEERLLKDFFGCGQVGRYGRSDNHREPLCRFTVRRRSDLSDRIIPSFEVNPLVTAMSADFVKFAAIVRLMDQGVHLTVDGLVQLAGIVETMNRQQPSRFLKSSEAIRQPSRGDSRDEDMVLASWRHGGN
jgi:hypothetical protein